MAMPERRAAKIPVVFGKGTGHDFKIDGLGLPGRMVKVDLELLREKHSFLERGLRFACDVEVNIDITRSGVLKEIAVMRTPIAKLSRYRGDRFYQFFGVYDANLAITLQEYGALFTSLHGAEVPHLRNSGWKVPVGLSIPKEKVESDKLVLDDYDQRKFLQRAHYIGGTFGKEVQQIRFVKNGNGIIESIDVSGDATCYWLAKDRKDPNYYTYSCHNTSNPDGALAVFGIVATHLNLMNGHRTRTF